MKERRGIIILLLYSIQVNIFKENDNTSTGYCYRNDSRINIFCIVLDDKTSED